MSIIAKARSRAGEAKPKLADVAWMIPLAIYRLSGRRLAASPEVYRAEVLWPRLARLPGMTTPTERAYFKWHAQERFLGSGAIVDLGSWLGSTTAALAMGLRANPRKAARQSKVHAYDRFTWEPWMEQFADVIEGGPYAPGDSFLAEFELVVKPWQELIQVHAGDLFEEQWSDGGIELLLVDAMKSWELSRHIVTRFYASLLPGAYVLHQDFGHCYTPWIHLISYRLRDHFVPAQDVVRSDTMVFRLIRELEPPLDEARFERAGFDDEEVQRAFEYSLSITSPEKHSGIRAAHAILRAQDGAMDGARGLLQEYERSGALNDFDADAVRGAIQGAEASERRRTSTQQN